MWGCLGLFSNALVAICGVIIVIFVEIAILFLHARSRGCFEMFVKAGSFY